MKLVVTVAAGKELGLYASACQPPPLTGASGCQYQESGSIYEVK